MGNAVAVMDAPDAPSGRINASRVILGGLVAGLLINISETVVKTVVLAADVTTRMAQMNLSPPGASAIVVLMLRGFAGGIATVWLYAVIRPRFGTGPRAALIAGLAVWFFTCLYPGIAMLAIGLDATRMMVIYMTWTSIELVVAALVGAALYSEG